MFWYYFVIPNIFPGDFVWCEAGYGRRHKIASISILQCFFDGGLLCLRRNDFIHWQHLGLNKSFIATLCSAFVDSRIVAVAIAAEIVISTYSWEPRIMYYLLLFGIAPPILSSNVGKCAYFKCPRTLWLLGLLRWCNLHTNSTGMASSNISSSYMMWYGSIVRNCLFSVPESSPGPIGSGRSRSVRKIKGLGSGSESSQAWHCGGIIFLWLGGR